MQKVNILLVSLLLFLNSVHSSNLNLAGTPVYNSTNNTLTFTVYWENSWKISTGPSNWDAVWIFVKRQNCNTVTNNQWVHQMINPTGNSVTTTNSPITVDAVTDNMGVFFKKNK